MRVPTAPRSLSTKLFTALALVLLLTAPAQAATRVTELQFAPKIDLNPNSATFRDPVNGIPVTPPCSGAAPVIAAGQESISLWLRVDADAPVTLTATWNHLPEGVAPTTPSAWRETLRSRVEIPEAKGFRVWMVKRLAGEDPRGRWIVTLSREGGEVLCSAPFRIE